jgi:hypothetical protein
VGTTSLGSVNTARYVTAGSGIGDVEITGSVTIPVVAATAGIHAIFLARFVDTSNWYGLLLDCDTGSQVDVKLCKMVGGSFTTLATAANELDYAAGTTIAIRFQCYQLSIGADLKARAWLSTSDEPDEWTLEDVIPLDNELLLGGVGVRGLLASGNTNSTPVVLSWGDFTAYSRPDYVDITEYVSIAQTLGAEVEGWIGRQTELSDIEPSRLSFAMKNQSGWFTPDNVSSPYWPDWGTGVPIRWSETIGVKTFAFPDMTLEVPEVSASTWLTTDEEASDRTLQVSCTDLKTQLDNAPAFVSNLAAHIIGESTEGALRAYWPLTDASGSTYATSAGPVNQDPLRFTNVDAYSPVQFVDTLVNFGNQDGPPGDDGPAVEFTPVGTATWGRLANSALVECETDPGASASNPDVATLVMWVYVPSGVTTLDQLALWREFTTFALYILVDGYASSGGTTWRVDFQTEGGQGAAVGSEIVGGRWHLIGAQLEFNLGDFALWVNGDAPATGSIGAGGTLGGLPLDRIVLDGSEGSASGLRTAHLQLYIGDSDAFTYEDFLAQYEVGINGLSEQTVDQRIRTIANYAGLSDAQLDLEESDSLIQQPTFANRRPGELISAAAATGGGIVFTAGDRLIYHDRKHRFNQ